jgi:uncharacterized protein YndB with AHSA1/START domain
MDDLENAAQLVGRRTVVFRRCLPVTPERLWTAISTRSGLSHWFMPTPYEVVPGGRFSFKGGWEGVITEVHALQRIQFTPDGTEDAFLRFEVSAAECGSVFKLIDRMARELDAAVTLPDAAQDTVYQPGGPGTHWSGILAGYHHGVDALEGYLTGSAPAHDYEQLCEQYVALLDGWFVR